MRLPSPAMVIALIALIVAMSGSAYAVTQLPKNSVGTAQLKKNAVTAVKLKNNAVTSAKIKNGTIQVADLSATARTELRGATGAQGPQGEPGAKGDPGGTGPPGERGEAGAESYAFRVGANNVLIVAPSGSTSVIDDFAIDAPEAGYLLITLRLTLIKSGFLCNSGGGGTISVTVDGQTVADLGSPFSEGSTFPVDRVAIVPVAAGSSLTTISMTCNGGQIPNTLTRSSWTASGALYPAQLTATTNTG